MNHLSLLLPPAPGVLTSYLLSSHSAWGAIRAGPASLPRLLIACGHDQFTSVSTFDKMLLTLTRPNKAYTTAGESMCFGWGMSDGGAAAEEAMSFSEGVDGTGMEGGAMHVDVKMYPNSDHFFIRGARQMCSDTMAWLATRPRADGSG
jgi:hypothetical protein